MSATHSERPRRLPGLHVWSATVTGVAALVLSIINFFLLQKDPHLNVTLPAVIRMEGGPAYSLFFIQPSLTTEQNTDEVEVVHTMALELRLTPANPAAKDPKFIWNQLGKWEYGEKSNALDYLPVGDPTPLVISRDQPQHPVMLFTAKNWPILSGRYEGRLLVHLSPDAPPEAYPFCLFVSPSDAAVFAQQSPQKALFQTLRNDYPGTPPEHQGCYVTTATATATDLEGP